MSDDDQMELVVGSWDWRRPKDIEGELDAEAVFSRCFNVVRKCINEEDASFELYSIDDNIACITALVEISVQAIFGFAHTIGMDPIELANRMEEGRPRE